MLNSHYLPAHSLKRHWWRKTSLDPPEGDLCPYQETSREFRRKEMHLTDSNCLLKNVENFSVSTAPDCESRDPAVC